MTKLFCASVDCSHNKNCKCTRKEVALKEWYIHTMHEGHKHMWECKDYEMSEEAQDMYAKIREVMGERKGDDAV